jgi:hypothetical protein
VAIHIKQVEFNGKKCVMIYIRDLTNESKIAAKQTALQLYEGMIDSVSAHMSSPLRNILKGNELLISRETDA